MQRQWSASLFVGKQEIVGFLTGISSCGEAIPLSLGF